MDFKLTTAQTLLIDMTHGADLTRDYKAPHAYRPTPPKPHYPRKRKVDGSARRRLFRGHRP